MSPESRQSDLRHSGVARVYVDPAPERGAHHGYRGPIEIDECGVHLGYDCDVLTVNNEAPGPWPMGDWSGLESPVLLPWHRVHSIEWQDEEAPCGS